MTVTGNQQVSHQRTVEYYDSIAHDYLSLYHTNTPGSLALRLRKQRVLELFDKPGGKVLDVGCGPGVMAYDLLPLNCAFWGIDPASRMIDQARGHFGSQDRAHFSVGTAEQIEFPSNFFDAVLCMGVMERVPDKEAAVKEMIRVLQRGGTLLIALPNKLSPYLLWRDFVYHPIVSLVRPLYYRWSGQARRSVPRRHSLFSARSYARELVQNGCVVEDIVYCGFYFFLPPLDVLFPGATATTLRRFEFLRDSMLKHLAGCFIVKASKS